MAKKAGARKCAHCKEYINVRNKQKLDHVLLYKKKFYHKECFIKLAESRVANQDRYSASWQQALDSIDQLVEDAKQSINTKLKTDYLNEYLIERYGVAKLSQRFWSMIADIGNGVYRRKRCRAIDSNTLLDMWKHYQMELDKTYAYNATHGKSMDGEGRVMYDLAIVMGKYGAYMAMKAKEAANAAEVANKAKIPTVDAQALYKQVERHTKKEKNNILDMMDEIF